MCYRIFEPLLGHSCFVDVIESKSGKHVGSSTGGSILCYLMGRKELGGVDCIKGTATANK